MVELVPYILAMLILIGVSAFFSASEAALFSLQPVERRALRDSSKSSERAAAILLRGPERLLSAILFWNLVTNIVYFAIASLTAAKIKDSAQSSLIVIGSLLAIIFFSEMLPKSFAVIKAKTLSGWVGQPLTVAVAVLDPVMPFLRSVTVISQRVLWPRFQAEPYLEVADLERAIEISTTSKELVAQERKILRSIVSLSDLNVEECMRPRTQVEIFRPPVSLDQVREKFPGSGYLFITERDSDEIASAVKLDRISDFNSGHLEHFTEPVVYVPWCNTAADALQKMHVKEREAAVVVNELGESIGVITRQDILDSVFSARSSRAQRVLNREPIKLITDDLWEVMGITNLSYLEEFFDIQLPSAKNVTVGGVMQETLQRLPEIGDSCEWGPFNFEVKDTFDEDQILIYMQLTTKEGGS